MKRRIYKSIALMLTLVLVLGSFSISALAANDEAVLDTVSHTSAISAEVDAQDNSVTLTVPYDYTGDVVLSSGLDISYDTAVYESASAEFPDGATAIVGGAAVRMRITYQRKDDATPSTTEYTVRVVRAAQIAPTFSGTITKSVSLPNSVVLAVADISERYAQNQGGVLDSIQIAGSDPTFGSLKLGAVSALGKTIKISDLQNGNLTFVPTDTGVVSYTISAYALGSEEAVGTAILKITIDVNESDDSDHFDDVGKNIKWAVEAIDYLYEHGILTGAGNGYYNPQASISRGDFMLMLSRAFDFESGFNGKFNPKSALSRQDAMVLLVRAMEASDIELPDGSGKALNPNSSVSRAEIAVILYRVLTI